MVSDDFFNEPFSMANIVERQEIYLFKSILLGTCNFDTQVIFCISTFLSTMVVNGI